MTKHRRLNPRYYNGIKPTAHRLGEILPIVLSSIQKQQEDRPDIILASWPGIVGEKIAPMTRAVSLADGVLTVYVRNATLHSLLCQHESVKILNKLRKSFPHANLQKIIFRIG